MSSILSSLRALPASPTFLAAQTLWATGRHRYPFLMAVCVTQSEMSPCLSRWLHSMFCFHEIGILVLVLLLSLLVLQQVPTHLVAKNKVDLLCHRSGDQQPTIGLPGIKPRCAQAAFPPHFPASLSYLHSMTRSPTSNIWLLLILLSLTHLLSFWPSCLHDITLATPTWFTVICYKDLQSHLQNLYVI